MTDDIARIYRAIIADSGVEATDLKVALDELVLQVRPGIESGAIVLDIDDAIRAAGRAIDKRDGGRVDGVLRSIARGEDALELDDDPVLDLVATLGAGRRKIWRFVTQDDLREMDALRFQNLEAQRIAYKRWREEYQPWIEVLFRHSTIGDAVTANDLPTVLVVGDGAA
ncbi:hypothetical protein [Nocardioides kribbensis]|uniref:hypothetical protein n=1 Tax=Nocardioides kribbensis TaxID=305517 RepID=UPI0018794BA9|nr:hypothetical protein [Nocardioides kribbensis]